MESTDKIERVLGLYTKLITGAFINKAEEAYNYNVSERGIQRDIEDIRSFMDQQRVNEGIDNSVIYDRSVKGYRLEKIYDLKFTNPEILAICKILLDSRAFTKNEMDKMLGKLIDTCVPETDQKMVKELIKNEQFHYIQPQHGKVFIDTMWQIGQAIQNHKYIEIGYQGLKGSTKKTRKLIPVAIMFSDFYFYLAAFQTDPDVKENFSLKDDPNPTIFRIDRLQGFRVLNENFHIPYRDRFEEGEYRKKIQFMFGGELKRVRFKCKKWAKEAVLDRLPTAKIEEELEDGYIVVAEVFGKGIDIWLKGQSDFIDIL